MLHPSYNELMEYVNENANPQENGEPLVQSRYTLVMAAAKRARQIVDARSKVQTSFTAADKPLSVAVKELYSGEVRILGENEEPDPVVPEAPEEASAEGASDEDASGDETEFSSDPETEEDTSETALDFDVSGTEDVFSMEEPSEVWEDEDEEEDPMTNSAENAE